MPPRVSFKTSSVMFAGSSTSGPEAAVAHEALHHLPLHFIRQLVSRESQTALGLLRGLALACLSNGVEEAMRKAAASSRAAGRQPRKSAPSDSAHRPLFEVFSDRSLFHRVESDVQTIYSRAT